MRRDVPIIVTLIILLVLLFLASFIVVGSPTGDAPPAVATPHVSLLHRLEQSGQSDTADRAEVVVFLNEPQPFQKGLSKLFAGQVPALAKPFQPKGEIPVDPNLHCQLASGYLLSLPKEEWVHKRFISWYGVPQEILGPSQRTMKWWMHQLTLSQFPVIPEVVPGSDGRLWMIDLQDYRWNAAAWQAVAERSPYFQEPLIEANYAVFLRDAIGYKLGSEFIKKNQYPVVAMVWAPWLFRDTIESQRSTSYYDLLFAEQRFGAAHEQTWRTETKTLYHPGGDYIYPDDSGRVSPKVEAGWYKVDLKYSTANVTAKRIDFPATEGDWNDLFGIKTTVDYMAKQRLNLRTGAVVAGSSDDPKGSIVAVNNRVVQVVRIPTGVALKTFDTDVTAGEFDYLERSPDAIVGDIKFKAGELLASLPNGGQAGLLIDAKGKRQELAPTTFAHNKVDPVYVDVRTMMGCVGCHGPDGGFIPPRDLVKELLAAGVDVKIKDRQKKNEFQAFYLEWEGRIKTYQEPYYDLIRKTTGIPGQKGWTGTDAVKAFVGFRVWYDAPVTQDQASRELGITVDLLRFQIRSSPNARLNMLLQGGTVPRATWDADKYQEAVFLYKSQKVKQ